jgi:phosphoribosylglycinamide formyltransferase-1
MVKKIKTCVFISGKGTNLNSLIKSSRNYHFPIEINLVISNKKNANGLKIAKKNSITSKYFSSFDQKKFEKKSLTELKKRKIKFLCLAGFMKILSKDFIKNFSHEIVNIHPSLLPKYKGTKTHEKVLKNKDKYSGCTVHFVTSKLDSGKIILQKKVLISKKETKESLKKKILKLEHVVYSKSITKIFK